MLTTRFCAERRLGEGGEHLLEEWRVALESGSLRISRRKLST